MQLPYFYEENIAAHSTHFILSEYTGKHCIQVLRMQTGEQLQLTDGKGNLFTASISQADKKNTAVNILQKELMLPHEKNMYCHFTAEKITADLNGSWKKQQK